MAIAAFDYAAWLARYPEFEGRVDAGRAALLFAEAGGLYLDNSDASPVQDAGRRLMLLNMIVAHLAALGGSLEAGNAPTGIVGRVTDATEGSVSVSVATDLEPGAAAWWSQTSYGLSFWAAMRRFRVARYIPGRQPNFEPIRGRPWRT